MSAFFRAALALAFASVAFPQSTKLQVRSATVDLEAHEASIDLFNTGDKTIVAYTLRAQEFDAAGKRVLDKVTGRDNRYYPEPGIDKSLQSGEQYLIHPGASFIYSDATQPETVRIEASIVSLINEDRTVEGDPKDAHLMFLQRADNVKELKQSIALVKTYPATPQQLSAVLQNLRTKELTRALAALANELHLSAETYSVLIDTKQPIPLIVLPSKDQWDEFVTKLSAEIGFWELQSQEVRQ